jgi:hypothetical protein
MRLTEEQKAEIRDYIVTVPKFRETYNELYDHILNALEDSETTFSIDEVIAVVNRDFGGFNEIVYQEKIYQKEIGKKYNLYFRSQFLETLRWYGIWPFLFCAIIFYGSQTKPFNIKYMLLGTIICFVCVAVVGFAKIVINRVRYSKYSILDSYLGLECSFGIAVVNTFLHLVLKEDIFNLSDNGKLIAMLSIYFFCVIYVRTFLKTYKTKFKILTA